MTLRQVFLVAVGAVAFALSVRETLDPDLWWHLRTGQLILEHGIPHVDPFSFTVPGVRWVTHEWLSEVFMALFYKVGGFPALILTFASIAFASLALVYARSVGKPYLAIFVTALAGASSLTAMGVRPQLLNVFMLSLFAYLFEKIKKRRRDSRWLFLFPPLAWLWANLHGGFLVGIAFLTVVTTGEALQQAFFPQKARGLKGPGVKRLAQITGISLLLTLINPNGYLLWLHPFLHLKSPLMQARIVEWFSPDFHNPIFWPFALMMAVGFLGWIFSKRRREVTEILLFLGTAWWGLSSVRHIPLFAVLNAPMISRHLLSSFKKTSLHSWLNQREPKIRFTPAQIFFHWFLAGSVLWASARWAMDTLKNNEADIRKQYPAAAVDFLQREGWARKRGFNEYHWGGYLIWRGLPVFADGRADVYGDRFLSEYFKTLDLKPDWKKALDQFKVEYVLIEPAHRLSILLLETREWKEAYGDDVAKVFVRKAPPA